MSEQSDRTGNNNVTEEVIKKINSIKSNEGAEIKEKKDSGTARIEKTFVAEFLAGQLLKSNA